MEGIVNTKGLEAAQSWLLKSIDVCDKKGSSAFYHPVMGWASAYPETTGYIIPTLLKIAQREDNVLLAEYALSCADWLCSIQLGNGSFPGGVGGELPPNVFDTGQIIFGLTAAYRFSKKGKYKKALEKAVGHLLEILEEDGSWQKEAYIENYIPSYYTRIIWAVLIANQVLAIPGVPEKMKGALDYYASKITKVNSIQNWAFEDGEPAFTHTIAYTIRGFLESGLLLKEKKYISLAEKIAEQIINLIEESGKLAGSYDVNWLPDTSYICVPGHFQLSIIFNKLFKETGKPQYNKWAKEIFLIAQKRQFHWPLEGVKGGFAGSYPLWGKYQRGRFPNWAVKFYLDAAYSF
jgi:hypothetical protein